MKTKIFIIIIIIFIILFYLAWKKDTLKQDIETPNFKISQRNPEKAKKTKAPNSREEKCRDIFESLTGRAYPTIRPNWLLNPKTGRKLELDGYCADLRSAFEYNGKQHYAFPNNFHKTMLDFDNLVERDAFKEKECYNYGVKLLVIPYDIKDHELYDYIRNHLIQNNIIQL